MQGPVSTVEPQKFVQACSALGKLGSEREIDVNKVYVPWQMSKTPWVLPCCLYVRPLDGPCYPSRAVAQSPKSVVQCTSWRRPSTPSESLTGSYQLMVDEDHGASDGLAGRPAVWPPLLKGIRARVS
jgi:hypothetical protein